METKLVSTLSQAISAAGLTYGMTISFHHHLRNGDYVLNLVLAEIARLGIRGLTLNASSLFDIHLPLMQHIRSGVVGKLQTGYVSAGIGRHLSAGILAEPVEFRSHGTRAADIAAGRVPIDVAFIAAPAADCRGNCTGKLGRAACGSLGYAIPDALHAKTVIVITDTILPYPLADWSISEAYVDYVVQVEEIGNPQGILSGTTQITRDPVGLIMAELAAQAIAASGLLKDGFSFQTGAGGASLAAAAFLKEIMLREHIQGSFALGGITGYLVDMLRAGCFRQLMDVQCFDLDAVSSIRDDPRHREISAIHYAAPGSRGAVTDSLDVVILGATEIDTEFNVNVHTDSAGCLMGGSGGHTDAAAGAALTIIIAPLFRARLPIITQHVTCISTPGTSVDLLVTQRGLAVNPAKPELARRLQAAGLPVVDIHRLKAQAESITGVPRPVPRGSRVAANILGRDGAIQDQVMTLPEEG